MPRTLVSFEADESEFPTTGDVAIGAITSVRSYDHGDTWAESP